MSTTITYQTDHERALWSRVYASIIAEPFLRDRVSPSDDADAAVLAMREREAASRMAETPMPA
jgi:hypothetical protein